MKLIVIFLLASSALWGQATAPTTAPIAAPTPATTAATTTEVAPSFKPAAFLVVSVNLIDLNWTDLSLQQESTFNGPLLDNWQKYLQQNHQGQKEIKQCREACEVYFQNWQDNEAAVLKGATKDEYTDGQWIKVTYNVSRDRQSGKFSWEGRVLLQDINSKTILASHDLGREEKAWDQFTQKKLNSALATRLYRGALPALRNVAQKLNTDLHYTRAAKLVIRNSPNMGDSFALIEQIKTRGANLGLSCEWKFVVKAEAIFLCLYRGEEKTFSDLLSSVKELKSSKSYDLGHSVVGTDHVLTLKAR